MIGRIHLSDSMTKQIREVVKELALAQELLSPNPMEKEPCMSTIATRAVMPK